MQLKAGRLAFKVALIYVIVAGCWILFSDKLLAVFISDPDERIYLSIIKGWGFVIVTGGLLYQVLRRLLQRWEREVEQRQKAEVAYQKAGEALRESEERFVNLFQKAPLSYQSLDADGRFIEVNEAWVATLGYSRAEVIGKWFGDFLAPEFVEAFRQRFPMFKAAGKIHSEFEMLHRNGERRFIAFEGRIGHKKDGSFQQTHCILQDITERKRAEETIARERQLLRTLIDLLPEIFYIKDLDSRFLIVNETLAKLVGKDTPAQVLGLSDANLFPAGLAAELRAEELKVFAGEPLINHENIMVFPDGRMHTVLTTKLPFRDSQGRICGLVGIGHDITERKQAEAVLQEREEQYRKVVESSPNCIFILQQNRFVLVNAAALKLFGASQQDELLGRDVFDFIHPDFHDLIRGRIVQAAHQEQPLPLREQKLLRRDGSVVEVEATSTRFQFQGQPALLVEAHDITTRKRAEVVLRESQALYYSLVMQLPAGIFRKDFEGRYVLVNPWFCRLKGMAEEEFLGKTSDEVAAVEKAKPDARELAIKYATEGGEHHRLILQTGKPIEMVEDYTNADGQKQFLHVMKLPVFNPDGKVTGTQGILFDITARKRAEEQVNLQFSALTAAANAIAITDRAGKIEWVNPAFTRLTGYSTDEAIGRNPRFLKSGQHPPEFYAGLWQTILAGHVWHGELVNKRKDGNFYTEDMTITPVRGADGQIAHFVAIKQDVTERRLLEDQLRQTQKMEAIGQLASGVAHDFNNILAVIQLQAGLLKAEQNLSVHQLDFASEIEKAAQRAADITRQLLLFSRKQALQPRDLDLNEVVTSITKMLQRTLGEDVQMQFKFSPQPLLVHADAGMVDQILMNLTVNARDAMPKGGQLIIETSAVEFDEVMAAQTSKARPGSFACVSVSDTGGGIPPEILPQIFEPFFTTKAVGKGTGLGLATVFGIVQQHQGWINVYSEAGQGTTFRIYFPRLTKASDKKANWSSLASIRSGNETILLVEDDSSLRASIRIALSRLGYRVLEAPTGVAALEVWKQQRDEIRLLFTDMVMPEGMNGKELARRLLQENPKLKVIYASGYSADLADKDLLLQEGVNFLTKPFAAHQLAQTIRDCLDKI
jgi:PAS domain S-box-containing protein